MSGIRVPLAVDAQVRVPFGPVLVPLRALVLLTRDRADRAGLPELRRVYPSGRASASRSR